MRKKETITILLLVFLTTGAVASEKPSTEPDYSAWNEILDAYYDPAHGMNYGKLKANDAAKFRKLRARMSRIDVSTLDRDEQLAFWINLYNISVVGVVVDHYPVDSIRDISTDPIIRLNVFKKDRINFQGKKISLNYIEHEKVRKFQDPRIHFAINCAAASCPPIRPEAFVGRVAAMVFFILMNSTVFSQLLASSGATAGMLEWATSFDVNRLLILLIMFFVLLVLGMFMDAVSMMLITVPIFFPLAQQLGFDLVWFGLFVLITIEMAGTTPPFGLLLYVMLGVAPPGTTLVQVASAAFPFLICDTILILILVAFPGLALWLPSLM